MSYSQSNSYCYENNHVADDDLSTVFDADTVVPDPEPLPPLPLAIITENHQQPSTSSPHPTSQDESPATTISELLRRINSTQHPGIPIREEVSNNHHQSFSSSSSSSSSKKGLTINNSSVKQIQIQETATATTIIDSSAHHSMKRPRRSSRLKQLQPVQSLVDISDSPEVEDENGLDDYYYEPNNQINEEAVTNQSFSSSSSRHNTVATTKKKLTKSGKREMKWRSKFEELCDYKRLHGDANVPQSNKQLGVWVMTQRTEYRNMKKCNNKKTCMTNERIEMLESIGFEWDRRPIIPLWNTRYSELLEFKEKYRHTMVPFTWKVNKQLGTWVYNQRAEYRKLKDNKHSCMTKERIKMLESIGFEWVWRPI